MALASGWKREDAVVSQATGRLQHWIAGGLWSAGDVDQGTRRLAQAMARLLAARAVLLLVRAPDNAWQPVALAMTSPSTPPGEHASPGEMNVLEFLLEEAPSLSLPFSLEAASGIFAGVVEPLPRDGWSPSQAAFAASAQAFVRDELAQAAAAQADSTGALEAHNRALDVAAASALWPSSRGLETVNVLGARKVLDSNNSVADWPSAGHNGSAWQSEPPSLLLLLPCSRAEDEAPAESACPSACGIVLAWIESEDGRLSDEWLPLWSSCAGQAGAWLESALRFERVGRSYRDLANLAARVVDARDATREGHGPLVAHACALMAQALGLGARETEEWEMAGLLHGIGRAPVADALLQKEGSLSIEERDSIRDSMQAGAQWLAQVEGWANVARLVRHAGERWDGQGYPDGLAGESIPLGSRALAIAMRFASLAQARPDREALGSLRNVGAALESEAGSALDANLTTLFLGTLRGGTR